MADPATMMSTKSAKVPLYLVLRNDLQRKIRSGELKVGEWLPSEAELQREYGMSQTPVRRALLELERAGMITRHQGRGSLVASQEMIAANQMIGLGTELRQRGHDVVSKLLEPAAIVEPPAPIASEIRLRDGEKAIYLNRMFVVDGEPSVLFEHYLGPSVPVELEELNRLESLYFYLNRHGVAPEWAHESITATLLTEEQSLVLETVKGSPALIRRRTAYSSDDLPIEHTTYWIRADRYEMRLTLRNLFG